MKRQHRLHSKGGCCSGSAVKRLALNGCSQLWGAIRGIHLNYRFWPASIGQQISADVC
jgi:hypothetical protein